MRLFLLDGSYQHPSLKDPSPRTITRVYYSKGRAMSGGFKSLLIPFVEHCQLPLWSEGRFSSRSFPSSSYGRRWREAVHCPIVLPFHPPHWSSTSPQRRRRP